MKLYNPKFFTKCPEVCIFALDDILYPYQPAHDAAYQALADKVATSCAISAQEFAEAYQHAQLLLKTRLADTAAAQDRLLYSSALLELLGLGSQVLLALDFEQTYWYTFFHHMKVFTGVIDTVAALQERGITLILISNLQAQIEFKKILYLGLDQYFDYVVTGEEIGANYSFAAGVQLACAKLPLAPKMVWVFDNENHPELDAIQICKLNNGSGIADLPHPADAVFSDYHKLHQFITGLPR